VVCQELGVEEDRNSSRHATIDDRAVGLPGSMQSQLIYSAKKVV